jgi:acetolactate synthase-1/2/3 large subunit
MAKAPGEVAPLVEEAFRQLLSGRPRPVGLEVPMDAWQRSAAVHPHRAAAPTLPPPVDEDAAEQAAKLLGRAERPMLVVGGGALEAGEEVRAIAEALTAPVMSFRMGRGVIGAHALDVRLPVGHRLWAEADVVLLVGTRGQNPLGTWGTTGLTVIRVDIDPEEMTRLNRPDVFLHGDAGPVLAAVAARLGRHNRARPGRAEAIAGAKAEVMARVEEKLAPQVGFLRVMREELPQDGTFVDELTQVGYVSRIWLPVPAPRRFLSTGLQGTLGWGFATALGAKAACPDRPVLSVSGDGGFMFTVQEMATAVQHGLAVVAVVFNDGAYGNVRGFQKQNFGGRVIASELRNPDFVRLAESFGAQGLRARTPEELRGALRRGFATTDGPTLIEVPVGELPSPWEFIMLPRVR